jgi:hypothetical protein
MTTQIKQTEIRELSFVELDFEALDAVSGGSTKQLLAEYDVMIGQARIFANIIQGKPILS